MIESPAMELAGDWSYSIAIRFGAGRLGELAAACRLTGMNSPLVVTDKGLTKGPIVAAAVQILHSGGLRPAVFSDLSNNPVAADVERGVRVFQAGCHDGIVAVGGGSALDCGKCIALMAGQSQPLFRFLWGGEGYLSADDRGIAPIVAVPTTAGTGAEIEASAIITDERSQNKRAIYHPKMLPRAVIADPAVTTALPSHLTAATGMDALSHNLEALCVPAYHPIADGVAVEGIRLIKEWLPVAVRDPDNLTARSHIMAAASMGAIAFAKGLGAMHALSHPIGALFDTHHGVTNAVLMPYVLDFNRSAITDPMGRLARYLDLSEHSVEAVVQWILELRREIGIPHTLKDLGLDGAATDLVARRAAADVCASTNAVAAGEAEFATIFSNAMTGKMSSGR